MPFDDRELHVVSGQQFVELFPIFHVQHGLQLFSRFSLPAVSFPAGHPRLTPLGDVGAVRDDLHPCPSTQLLKSLDNRLQFHSVVGGFRITTTELFFFPAGGVSKNAGPTAGTWVSTAGAVGEYANKWK